MQAGVPPFGAASGAQEAAPQCLRAARQPMPKAWGPVGASGLRPVLCLRPAARVAVGARCAQRPQAAAGSLRLPALASGGWGLTLAQPAAP